MSKKRLQVVTPSDQKLGLPTIMDRALAQRYGAAYVHMAAFAIDLDRVSQHEASRGGRIHHEGHAGALPFGWEVWLLERYLERMFADPAPADLTPMVEEACLTIMEGPRGKARATNVLGAQLPFAVYYGVARAGLPNALGSCFLSWKKPPLDLLEQMNELDREPALFARLVEHCLNVPLTPALVPPVREALAKFLEE